MSFQSHIISTKTDVDLHMTVTLVFTKTWVAFGQSLIARIVSRPKVSGK